MSGFGDRHGDVDDLRGLAAALTRRALPRLTPDELDDLTSEAVVIAVEIERDLAEGASLAKALAMVLPSRAIDRWRELHPEHRRNTRAGTTREVGVGRLPEADRIDASRSAIEDRPETIAWRDQERVTESRLALETLTEADYRNPTVIGRLFFGVPSHRPVATVAAREIAALAEAERELTVPDDFTWRK